MPAQLASSCGDRTGRAHRPNRADSTVCADRGPATPADRARRLPGEHPHPNGVRSGGHLRGGANYRATRQRTTARGWSGLHRAAARNVRRGTRVRRQHRRVATGIGAALILFGRWSRVGPRLLVQNLRVGDPVSGSSRREWSNVSLGEYGARLVEEANQCASKAASHPANEGDGNHCSDVQADRDLLNGRFEGSGVYAFYGCGIIAVINGEKVRFPVLVYRVLKTSLRIGPSLSHSLHVRQG